MIKPASLRARLVAAFPEFATDPDRLRMWVEAGRNRLWAGQNLNFETSYTLTIIVESWTHSPLMIWAVVLDWLQIEQPERVTPSAPEAFAFEADILDTGAFDLEFKIDLSEAISMIKREDGGFDMAPVAEPDPLFPDAEGVIAGNWAEAFIGGDLVALHPDQ
jgi:hypothetical protein